MSAILPPHPTVFPHNHEVPRRSPQRSMSPFNMPSSRKRKADDDDLEMGSSPAASPAVSCRQLIRPVKRNRQIEVTGRQLTLPRLLETLDTAQLRTVLEQICIQHPDIGHQVQTSAPRPTPAAVLDILDGYMTRLKAAMPYGNSSSDYTYNRVKQPLIALIEALADFTVQFLPPVETQFSASLQFLDGATKFIHALPNWDSPSYSHHKETAYDEISKAWALVFKEAASRGGTAFQITSGGWEQTMNRHNAQAGGRLDAAVHSMQAACNWVPPPSTSNSDTNSIRSQLMSGTYGLSSVRVGHW